MTTDGGSGSTGSGNSCSASTGYLSTLEDGGDPSSSSSGRNKRLPFGGSDQGLNSSNNRNRAIKSVNTIEHQNRYHQQGRTINQSKEDNSVGRGRGDNNDGTVNESSRLRQFHSLPRMSSNSTGSLSLFAPSSSSSPSAAARALGLAPASKTGKRSFNKEFEKESK